MDRRRFLTAAATSVSLAHTRLSASEKSPPLRVGVIGHTGRGRYGHGLDTVWKRVPETTIVAVADADPLGLEAAKKKLDVDIAVGDYREMLEVTRPELVAVCPRHPDQHRDMILAAIASGAKGIYVEKPFCRSPREADEIIEASESRNVKVAVAHRNRWHPTLKVIDRMIEEQEIGRLLEIRGRGKGDRRGGGEDLWVLGSHVLNLMAYFGGKPIDCSAVLLQQGSPVTREDVQPGNEGLGPLAGDEVHARYRMVRGPIAYFDSVANDGMDNAGFGLQLIGSRGVIDLKCDRHPIAHWLPGNPLQPNGDARSWIPITSGGPGVEEPRPELADLINHHVLPVSDLIETVQSDRQPKCDAREGALTVEMICAAFESHRQGGSAIPFPLRVRENPLSIL